MKKLLLGTYLIVLSAISMTAQQVVFSVEAPASIFGTYGFTYTEPAGGWGGPDLLDTANAVMDTLMFVDDGTAGTNPQGNPMSAEGCNPLVNDLTGKIAVIYRNTCEFGTKILNAENAGAVAAIIINREPGLVNMAPGTDGANVTIPAIFIEDATGGIITAEMANGPVVVFIGTRNYDNNLAVNAADVVIPEAASIPAALAADQTEYEVQLGAFVSNPGNLDQDSVVVNAQIEYNGALVYDQTSAEAVVASNDSVYFSLPTFSQASYGVGAYTLTYTVSDAGMVDEFPVDNSFSSTFYISNTVYSTATVDSVGAPVCSPYYRPNSATGSVSVCTHFMDPNASRMAAMGINFSAVVSGGSLAGRYFSTYGYEWADSFTDFNDPNFAGVVTLNTISVGEITYDTDSAYQNVYVPFTEPMTLNDNTRYLFCAQSFDTDVYFGFDDAIDYNQNVNAIYGQPVSLVENSGTWYATGFGTEVTAGVSVELSTNLGLEQSENMEINPFPNPATNSITIPLNGINSSATLNIVDVTGKTISVKNINNATGNIEIDVTDIANGNYVFNLLFANGETSKFNVVITK
ncbi:MAG: hypothetical protein CL846_04210 [Crocinitomicaceae bacterium]|nr:hypothetical protein [Crocinitomicaceae bacterium]|tara:strand:+ start:11153 stop:12880 length:1728 start_codon:yes stop_codon:yes gene_type:complete